ncbi:hypothetical protein ONZ45_g1121 [Pleurotus djamor]|nr:hypothetical protein ONZ45_g1121 [Pleurotus djamor]
MPSIRKRTITHSSPSAYKYWANFASSSPSPLTFSSLLYLSLSSPLTLSIPSVRNGNSAISLLPHSELIFKRFSSWSKLRQVWIFIDIPAHLPTSILSPWNTSVPGGPTDLMVHHSTHPRLPTPPIPPLQPLFRVPGPPVSLRHLESVFGFYIISISPTTSSIPTHPHLPTPPAYFRSSIPCPVTKSFGGGNLYSSTHFPGLRPYVPVRLIFPRDRSAKLDSPTQFAILMNNSMLSFLTRTLKERFAGRFHITGWFLLGIKDITFDSPLTASQILEYPHNPESLPKSNHTPRFPTHLVTLPRVYDRLARPSEIPPKVILPDQHVALRHRIGMVRLGSCFPFEM